LRRSLALLLVVVAPALIAVFVFFNLLRGEHPMPWQMLLQSTAAIWAFFMLPMSVTALTALVAQTEHEPRAWDTLRALPVPRWHLYAAKAVGVLILVVVMSVLLAILTLAAVATASWLKPAIAPSDTPDIIGYAVLLGRIFLASWLLIAVQLWIALRFPTSSPRWRPASAALSSLWSRVPPGSASSCRGRSRSTSSPVTRGARSSRWLLARSVDAWRSARCCGA
jgi:hypothetical protein